MGLDAKRMMAIVRETFRSANTMADGVFHLAGWLEKTGFINIQTEMRRVPLNGEMGKPMRENLCRAYIGIKTQALRAGGFGLVETEEEYDSLVQAHKEEMTNNDNAAQQAYMIFAQKPLVVV